MQHLHYPIGIFIKPEILDEPAISACIQTIETFPGKLKREVHHLTAMQLDTPYRPQGWTIRQVVHHCADSHMNSFIRFKLALTEDNPTVKPYYEDRWAELVDAKNMDITPSLDLLTGLHIRWSALLNALTPTELKRVFIHPEHNKSIELDEAIALYAWHCNHHLAHIITLKGSNHWS